LPDLTETIQLNCEAVIFDLDGVQVDSSACIEKHWRLWTAKHGLDAAKILSVMHGRRTVESMRLVAPHLEVEKEAAQLEAVEAVDIEGVVEIAGARALMQALPVGRWAIATSGGTAMATNRLACTGLPIPPVLITADDVSRGKPDPEPYLLAAQGLGFAPSDCVVIEDAPAGIQAARAAGMRVLAVATTHAPGELVEADLIVERLLDLQLLVGQPGAAGLSLMIRPQK
jgi:mannitol-1-/sugar-/sorbitol-6-phosphatase